MDHLRLFLLTIYCTFCFGYGAAIKIRISCSDQAVCPDGWVKSRGSCYLFQQDEEDFSFAEDLCKQSSSHLVVIESTIENKFLQNQLKQRKDDQYRIGIYTNPADKGKFTWLNLEGKGVLFTDFQPKADGNSNDTDLCGVFSPTHHHQWDLINCQALSKSICEKEATPCPTCGVFSVERITSSPGENAHEHGTYTEEKEEKHEQLD